MAARDPTIDVTIAAPAPDGAPARPKPAGGARHYRPAAAARDATQPGGIARVVAGHALEIFRVAEILARHGGRKTIKSCDAVAAARILHPADGPANPAVERIAMSVGRHAAGCEDPGRWISHQCVKRHFTDLWKARSGPPPRLGAGGSVAIAALLAELADRWLALRA